MDKIRKLDHSNASFPMVRDIMLYNVGLPFQETSLTLFSKPKFGFEHNLLILSKVKEFEKSLDYLVMRY